MPKSQKPQTLEEAARARGTRARENVTFDEETGELGDGSRWDLEAAEGEDDES